MEPNEFIRLSNGWWKETDLLVGLLATNSDFQHSIGAIWRGIYVPMRSVKVEWKFLLFETDVFRKKKHQQKKSAHTWRKQVLFYSWKRRKSEKFTNVPIEMWKRFTQLICMSLIYAIRSWWMLPCYGHRWLCPISLSRLDNWSFSPLV